MKTLSPIIHMIFGLAATQFFFTFWVYQSNLRLYDQVSGLMAAGYFAVPNAHLLPTLKNLSPAIFGGLFFTFTIGIALSFTAFATAWMWIRIFSEKKAFLSIIMTGVGLFLILIEMNRTGPAIVISTWFLTVFGYLFFVTALFLKRTIGAKPTRHLFFHVPIILLLGFLSAHLAGGDIHACIRDRLLMSNPIGQRVVDFYYQYALYPAEAIKSLDQKLFITAHMEFTANDDVAKKVKEALVTRGWLLVDYTTPATITVRVNGGGEITFLRNKKEIYSLSVHPFLNSPDHHLNAISEKSDNHRFIKKMIACSLAYILPLTAYTGFSVLAFAFIRRFTHASRAAALAGLFSLFFFLMSSFFLTSQSRDQMDISEVSHAVSSESLQRRVQAMRTIYKRGENAEVYGPHLLKMATSDEVLERLWAARTLSLLRGPESTVTLRHLLADTHPNVVCMALYSLGRLGDRSIIPLILERIRNSRHWYVQWYGYRTLKDLGWQNRQSDP